MDICKLKEKLTDADMAKKISEITEANELQTFLVGMEIEISMEEAEQVVNLLTKVRSGEVTEEQLSGVYQQLENDNELDEEALASVSGGFLGIEWGIVAIVTLICTVAGGGLYALTKVK